ncbi:MAG TPA: NAD-dependent epimerase/dehydratase family protein [Verrucomicrobiae bacterium]|nr:NAD-dependent epimerase/dehydratase family protein [Verrucomicrobiae bacterium]
MKALLVTGAAGFMGRNLCVALRRAGQYEVLELDMEHGPADLARLAARADLVFHLAGVNRPKEEREFTEGNVEFTRELCSHLTAAGRRAPLVLSSSIQAELDNPYGRSKRAAEDVVFDYHRQTGAPVYVYRFPNVFGKWSRPNYNTVVATFCHNIGRGLPVQVSNRQNVLHFVYIDDIVRAFVELANRAEHPAEASRCELEPVYTISLGELHDLIVSFHENRRKSLVPDLSNPLIKYLYSTYVSFYETRDLAYPVELKTDERGWLFELVKSAAGGQIFVSRTKPGVTRGNHYHDSKLEKFCVIQGEGLIRFRHILGSEIVEYAVSDREIRIVDIPPGYTHSIENTGSGDMLTLFWANEIFDPQRPDTYFVKVK